MAVKRTLRGVSIFPSPEAMKKLSETRFIQWYLPFTRSSIPAVGILKEKKKLIDRMRKIENLTLFVFYFLVRGSKWGYFDSFIFSLHHFVSFRLVSFVLFRSVSRLVLPCRVVSFLAFRSIPSRVVSLRFLSYRIIFLYYFCFYIIQCSHLQLKTEQF